MQQRYVDQQLLLHEEVYTEKVILITHPIPPALMMVVPAQTSTMLGLGTRVYAIPDATDVGQIP